MSFEYSGHTYRIEIHGKASQAKGYRVEYILLWVDDKQIKTALGTYFEPLSTGSKSGNARQEAWDYAESAAKRIIDHLVQTGKTVHQL
jgi:hypothetical protein